MANHMETYINIKNGDIKVAEKLKDIFTPPEGEYETNTEDLYKRLYGDEAPEEYDRGWVCDNLGAKWVYSDFEYDEEPQHIHLMLTSAWSVPIQLLEKLAEVLTDIKEDCYICGTYEDESMDPCGAFIYAKDYDDIEDYDDEYDWDKDEEDDFYRETWHDKIAELGKEVEGAYLEFLEDKKNNPEDYE
jgi:hypothetical protein